MAKTGNDTASAPAGMLKLPVALRRDLLLLVAAKLAMLGILYALFFSPAHQPAIDAAAQIAGTHPQR